jgi:hypothetical protein
LLDFRGSAAVLAWISACCSSIMGSFFAGLSVTSVARVDINIGENSNSVGGVPIDVRPRISGLSWLGCGFGLDSRLLLKHHAVLFAGLSVTSVTGGDINSGENSNSVGGVPVDIRPRIAGFSWLGCVFGLYSRLLLKHHAVLFGRPFGDECPWG